MTKGLYIGFLCALSLSSRLLRAVVSLLEDCCSKHSGGPLPSVQCWPVLVRMRACSFQESRGDDGESGPASHLPLRQTGWVSRPPGAADWVGEQASWCSRLGG